MVSSAFVWAIFALGVVARPAPDLTFSTGAARPAEKQVISEYFNMLAQKVQEGRHMAQAPVCNMASAVPPVLSPTPMPSPSAGLVLKHVAIGRGTQNYTCGSNATAAPTATGAVATLFNATCVAATYPDLLAILPNVALQFPFDPSNVGLLKPAELAISGRHFFTNATTPFFDLNYNSKMKLGRGAFAKIGALNAPTGASIGQNNKGYGAVAWLQLNARTGASDGLQEVYRLNTAGGSPPPTCADNLNSNFDVQYAAEYWFYEKA
ncbi:malate dehydrogenase protein [Rutstroemia sp. NJR-2017a BBW]|nr:malate dehydrogenase protein [Rutstroemia sp. NJR-2017a BBW]